MIFNDIQIGFRFLHLDAAEDEYYFWRKVDETSAVKSTPQGHDYGAPVKFSPDAKVRCGR